MSVLSTGVSSFSDLGLSEALLKSLTGEGYTVPTPIQAKAIPPVLAGRDVLGCAQTGTGKTAAFALPMIQRMAKQKGSGGGGGAPHRVRALILTPTRELASQIADSFKAYGKHNDLRGTVIFGGVSQHWQEKALRAGADWVVATPGRLLDLVQQGICDLRHVETLVLDEADHMLDMGFIHDIRRIITKLPAARQNLLFSATMPKEIRELANSILKNPVSVEVTRVASTVEAVSQSVYFVDKRHKPTLLAHYLNDNAISRALVFTRTKHGADKVARHLCKAGIRAEAIHGNKNQNARMRAIAAFKSSNPPVLVATDIAARGLDIDEVSHVINYDVPNIPETYVHRIGRTARAGLTGDAVSFCDREERGWLKSIEKLTRRTITVKTDHPVYPEHEEKLEFRPSFHEARNGHSAPAKPQAQRHTVGQGAGHHATSHRGGGMAVAAPSRDYSSAHSRGPRPGGNNSFHGQKRQGGRGARRPGGGRSR